MSATAMRPLDPILSTLPRIEPCPVCNEPRFRGYQHFCPVNAPEEQEEETLP